MAFQGIIKQFIIASLCCLPGFLSAMPVYPLNQPISMAQLQQLSKASPLEATINPEVTAEINRIRNNEEDRMQMLAALSRMKRYAPYIARELKSQNMPHNLLALPLIESGYQPLDESLSPVRAAGLWQITPALAAHYGLVINGIEDQRLSLPLSTQAALSYLQTQYIQFNDWKLAVIAYAAGQGTTQGLVKMTRSNNAWIIVKSFSSYQGLDAVTLRRFLTRFDASIVMMNHPELLTGVQPA